MASSRIKVRLLSDLHLELLGPSKVKRLSFNDLFYPRPSEEPKEPKGSEILVLAGDIGDPFKESYALFLTEASTRFKYVIVVAGNHEYYNGQPMKFVNDKIRRVVSELPNVYFLNVDSPMSKEEDYSVVLDDIMFIGTTLWSPGSKNASINDMVCINAMSRDRYYQLHLLHQSRLKKIIEDSVLEYPDIVVITHHLPCRELISDEYLSNGNEELHKFYYSEQSECINTLKEVVGKGVWLCGHSHRYKCIARDNVELYLNPYGYYGEDTNYQRNLVIEI